MHRDLLAQIPASSEPTYFYSARLIRQRVEELQEFITPRFKLLYSIKANPFPPLLKFLSDLGLGADVSSGEELRRSLGAGFKPISFCGPGKTLVELEQALAANIETLVVESIPELRLISKMARNLDYRPRV